jgi:HAD superfamily hydrolase (TIGR01484 family)
MEKLFAKADSLQAIAVDVDGTLRQSGTLDLPTNRVIAAFRFLKYTLEQSGRTMHRFVATASPYSQTRALINELEFTGPQITSGGAEIVEAQAGQLIRSYPLEIGTTREICRFLHSSGILLGIQDGGVNFPIDDYQPNTPYTIISDVQPSEADQIIAEIKSRWSDISVTKIIPPPEKEHLVGIHVSNARANKYSAVLEVADLLQINPVNILGIGDGPNDVGLLKACGIRVALRTDSQTVAPSLKKVANIIAPSLKNDGVAVVLDNLIHAIS